MNHNRRWFILSIFLLAALMGCLVPGANAQGSNGTLVLGQPLPNQVTAGGQLNYDLTVNQTSQVTLQALSDTAQPTLKILHNGEIVASQPNIEGAITTSLTDVLNPGAYIVQVGAANNTAGLVILVLQNLAPITSATLTPSTPLGGVIGPQSPLALYTFAALPEPAFLYIDGEAEDGGVSVRLVNTTTGQTSGQSEADLLGVRFRIPPGSNIYQVEVQGGEIAQPFTICLAAVTAGGCEVSLAPTPPPTLVPTVETACTISSGVQGGVNIRQSASTTSLIIGRLPDGASATVTGISPDGTFYNVIYNNRDGWIAVSVVTSNGNCAGTPVTMPPPIIPQPTAIPPTAVAPTAPPPPTQPQPTQPIPQTSVPGACLITINSDTFVYTKPVVDQSNLFDQTHQGYQLIPTGRLTDNSWWVTNYGGAWIETNHFGQSATVSGDCSSLPIVPPPQ